MRKTVIFKYKHSQNTLRRKLARIEVFPSTIITTKAYYSVTFEYPWYKFIQVRRIINGSKRIDHSLYQSQKWCPIKTEKQKEETYKRWKYDV